MSTCYLFISMFTTIVRCKRARGIPVIPAVRAHDSDSDGNASHYTNSHVVEPIPAIPAMQKPIS